MKKSKRFLKWCSIAIVMCVIISMCSCEEKSDEGEQETLSGIEVITMKGHPVLGDCYSDALNFWDDNDNVALAEYPASSIDGYGEETVLCVDALDNEIECIEIEIEKLKDKKRDFDESLKLIKKYAPQSFNKYKYSYSGVIRSAGGDTDEYLIMYENSREKDDCIYILIYTEPEEQNKVTEAAITKNIANHYDFDSSDWSYNE